MVVKKTIWNTQKNWRKVMTKRYNPKCIISINPDGDVDSMPSMEESENGNYVDYVNFRREKDLSKLLSYYVFASTALLFVAVIGLII